ncbi:unnamed protein product [Paramecium octaurelia]|uniref:Uncharacterized protein n=1 Tax=Paramecium octaurelia TaxID=43137 RepID=A0A8S1TMX5_PAROT|nr:unnamed protein product [Paramecium octaurelia]
MRVTVKIILKFLKKAQKYSFYTQINFFTQNIGQHFYQLFQKGESYICGQILKIDYINHF